MAVTGLRPRIVHATTMATVVIVIAVAWLAEHGDVLAAAYVVDTTIDNHNLTACTAADNDCSLRGALNRAALVGSDSITFDPADFSEGTPGTIVLTEGVLSVSATSTTIDGTGAGVIIKGNGEPAGVSCISIPSGSSIVIKNVRITDCANGISVSGTAFNIQIGPGNVIYDNVDGIEVSATDPGGYFIEGNFIGTDSAGTGVHPDGGNATGVHVSGGANAFIGDLDPAARNIISGNTDGVVIDGSAPADLSEIGIVGNYIGLDAAGAVDVGNTGDGVRISGNNVTYNDIESNVISGNGGDGVDLASADNNGVRNNKIGTNATGTAAVGNGLAGVRVSGNNNLVGGSSLSRNLISGNTDGVIIEGGTLNDVLGNRIGTNEAGTGAIPNTDAGIEIVNASTNFIGLAVPNGNLISGNGADGVRITGTSSANDVFANYIGTNLAGTGAIPNGNDGIEVAASNNAIGDDLSGRGNVISGNAVHGIRIPTGTSGVTVQGNFIGTDAAGTADLGNSSRGIQIEGGSTLNVIGGSTVAARNVISGNNSHGIGVTGASDNNEIRGNFIGTDATGSLDRGNTLDGIHIEGSDGNTIGGNSTADRNIISGNNSDGIELANDANSNVVKNNYVGTDFTGTLDRGNSAIGVHIVSSDNNVVGGANQGNLSSGNSQDGVEIGSASLGNTVQGNILGLASDNVTPLGNGTNGIQILGSSSNNTVGGDTAAEANHMAFNGGDGITVSSGTGNLLARNSIHSNVALGIDLNNDNIVTPNDAAPDGDTGANNLQNFPVLSSVTSVDNITNIIGTLTSAVSTQFTVRYYHSPECDASGNGEGETHFAMGTVTTNGSGAGNINSVFLLRIPTLSWVTATATDPAGNTSEFSACRQVLPILVDTNSDANLTACTSAPSDCSLRGAINKANAYSDYDVIHFAIGSGIVEISPTTALPTITQPVLIDGTTQPGFVGMPIITLEGDSAGNISGLMIANPGGGSTIRGLLIRSFNVSGVVLAAGGNTVEGNLIGTDGEADLGNSGTGVVVSNSSGNTIGGDSPGERNIISGNNTAGIEIAGPLAGGNKVTGNYIGTNASGTAAIPNGTGVRVRSLAGGSDIGGDAPWLGNLISGNLSAAISLEPGTSGTEILGNMIGLNATGVSALANLDGIVINDSDSNAIGSSGAGVSNVISGNLNDGVQFLGGSTANSVVNNIIGLDADGDFALGNGEDGISISGSPSNTIGGSSTNERNIISGNNLDGIFVFGAASIGNEILGNYVGTNAAGTAAAGNGYAGIEVIDAVDTLVGGGAANLISGNTLDGIRIESLAAGTGIQGNRIGTDAGGTTGLGNGSNGVLITASGVMVNAANIVAFNNFAGVRILTGTANQIEGNSIHSNGGLGIDIGSGGVTPNDGGAPPDQDTGPNNLLNFPVISLVTSDFTFYGSLVSSPNTSFTLHAYYSAVCDTSGHGEGETPMTSFPVVTNAQGYAQFLASKGSAPIGSFVTATVMDAAGNTSEFSPCVEIKADWDDDGVPDTTDNCAAWSNPTQSVPAWAIPANDPDCDGFSTLIEAFNGTDPARHCSETTSANDEPVDAWPPDFNDSRATTLADVASMGVSYNRSQGQAGYSQRFDLNASNSVTLADVVLMSPFYNRSCA